MQWNWTLHTQGPDEPVYIIEADGTGRFIARVDEERKTRAEVMKCGFMLAAAPELLESLQTLTELCEEAGLYPLNVEDARTAIAKAKGKAPRKKGRKHESH